ncbi:Uncharacterised protein [Metamycoplasma arthritidis]|uniref:Conserved hypothetical lipoprotein n=1 Tax=Metamycoplasma arthritidis (strain 158L3-1) TaxID=243272 RepID=B3PMF6_META1|nr:lipoprotein 17-related variable surface protein [Metamycoplasma arthritidis]ACF07208.1 conserved hypothetical lipoprotein [Metamycoplasma arthritidis 158L3-1]VEU78732.1 Uncharacterised protein [Metamycoplasma arthritidis]
MKKKWNKKLISLLTITTATATGALALSCSSIEEILKSALGKTGTTNYIGVTKGFDKSKVLPSDFKPDFLEYPKNENGIYFRIAKITPNNHNGTLVVSYFLEKKATNGEWIKSQLREYQITGFKTYNDLATDYLKKVEVKNNKSNQQNYLPSEYAQNESNFIFKNIPDDYELKKEILVDDEAGTITIKYHLINKKLNSKSITTQKVFDGFDTNLKRKTRLEVARLNELFNETNTLEVTSAKKSLFPSKLTADDFKNKKEDAEIVITAIKAQNDALGTVQVSFYLKSTKKGLEHLKTEEKTITLEGFLTTEEHKQNLREAEKNRLNGLLSTQEVAIDDKNPTTKKDRLASSITKGNLEAKLLGYSDVSVKILQISYDEETGKVTATVALTSRIASLNEEVESTKTKQVAINGYLTLAEHHARLEKARLETILNNINGLEPKNSDVKFSELLPSQINAKEHFKLQYDDYEIEVLSSDKIDDEKGILELTIRIRSLKPNFKGLMSESTKKITLSGFETTASLRIKTLRKQTIEELNNKLSSAQFETQLLNGLDAKKAETLPSQALDLANYKVALKNGSERVKILNARADDENGTITLKVKLVTHNDELNEDLESSNTREITIGGFITKAEFEKRQEIERLDSLLNNLDILSLVNNLNKENLLASEVTKDSFKTDIGADYQAIITKIVETNIEAGTIKLKLKLLSRKTQFNNLESSFEKEITISGFLTKSRYIQNQKSSLNGLLKTLSPSISLNNFDKDNNHAGLVKKENLDINLNNATLTLGNVIFEAIENGSKLKIRFKVRKYDSKIGETIESDEEFTHIIKGFLTKAKFDELARLNELIQYQDLITFKEDSIKTKAASSISASDLKLNDALYGNKIINTEVVYESIKPNPQTGQLEVTYHLKSKVHSDIKTKSKTIVLMALSDEQYRINSLANNFDFEFDRSKISSEVYSINTLKDYLSHPENLAAWINKKQLQDVQIKTKNVSVEYDAVTKTIYVKYEVYLQSTKDPNVKSKTFVKDKINFTDLLLANAFDKYKELINLEIKNKATAEVFDPHKLDKNTYSKILKFKELEDFLGLWESITKSVSFSDPDDNNGTVTAKLSIEYREYKITVSRTIFGLGTKEKIKNHNDIEVPKEIARLNNLIKTLKAKYTGTSIKHQPLEEVSQTDFDFNNPDDTYVDFVHVDKIKAVNSKEKQNKFVGKVRLGSKRPGFEDIFSLEIYSFEEKGFSVKKHDQETKQTIESELPTLKQNYHQKQKEQMIAEGLKKLANNKQYLADVTKEQFEKFNGILEQALVDSFNQTLEVIIDGYGNSQEVRELYRLFYQVFVNQSPHMLNFFTVAANGPKQKPYLFLGPRGINTLKNLVLFAQHVGPWSRAMFQVMKDNAKLLESFLDKYIDGLVEFPQLRSIINDPQKSNIIKETVKNLINYVIEFYYTFDWNVLTSKEAADKQKDYSGGAGRPPFILGSAWRDFFSTDKFIEPKHDAKSSYRDLTSQMKKLVDDNKLTQQEHDLIFQKLKDAIFPILNIFGKLNQPIYNAFKEIVGSFNEIEEAKNKND